MGVVFVCVALGFTPILDKNHFRAHHQTSKQVQQLMLFQLVQFPLSYHLVTHFFQNLLIGKNKELSSQMNETQCLHCRHGPKLHLTQRI